MTMKMKLLSALALLAIAAIIGSGRKDKKGGNTAQEERDQSCPAPEEGKEGPDAGTAEGLDAAASADTAEEFEAAADADTDRSSYAYFTFSAEDGEPRIYVRIDDPSVASCYHTTHYVDDGRGGSASCRYDVRLELRGLKPGETRMTLISRGESGAPQTMRFRVSVNAEKKVGLEYLKEE